MRTLPLLLTACLLSLIAEPAAPARAPASFPGGWEGRWTGTLHVLRGADTLQRVPMRLTIAAADLGRFTWAIGYGPAGEDERPYLLLPVPGEPSRWRVDERNGIVLEAALHGGVLYSRFAVMGSLLLARDEVRGDTLYHEVVSGRAVGTATGDTVLATGDTIPAVERYSVATRQVARLVRR